MHQLDPHLRRPWGAVLTLVLAAVSLTGCLDITGDVTVAADGSSDANLVVAVDREVADLLGVISTEGLADQLLAEDDVFPGAQVKTDVTETEEAFVATLDVTGFPAAESLDAAADQLYAVTVEGDQVLFRLVNAGEGTGAEVGGEDLGSTLPFVNDLGTVSLTVDFPGPIDSVEGTGVSQVDDDTVRIALGLAETDTIEVTAAQEGGLDVAWQSVLAVLGLLALAVLAVVLLRRQSRAAAASADDGTQDAPVQDWPEPSADQTRPVPSAADGQDLTRPVDVGPGQPGEGAAPPSPEERD